ncbi:MAG: diacylglycerol kinase [Parcubacteria group bacterium LiPW_30]|nr:MAG: diacylglycerol kinase [Parcubacteria group bacterium LiPW_30]
MNKKFIKSFTFALKGLKLAWKEEFNFKIEIFLGLIAILLALTFQVNTIQFAIIFLTIVIVLAVEMLNTALEELCDKLRPENDPYVAKIKDLAASAVLISSIGAITVGIFIFGPYLLEIFLK